MKYIIYYVARIVNSIFCATENVVYEGVIILQLELCTILFLRPQFFQRNMKFGGSVVIDDIAVIKNFVTKGLILISTCIWI